MIVERFMDPGWLSNAYLVGDGPGGRAVVVDTGGPLDAMLERVEALKLRPTLILCTHAHADHVAHNRQWQRRFRIPVAAHPLEAAALGGVELELADGQAIEAGDLELRVLHTPGHTRGMLAFVVNDEAVFTGDTLFRASVGGTSGGGPSGFEDLKRSILEVLLRLPRATRVYPGHAEPTTVGEEWEANPFVRAWRGLECLAPRPCRVHGRAATLLLEARDYDGGTKCWIRTADGRDMIVGGSQVHERG